MSSATQDEIEQSSSEVMGGSVRRLALNRPDLCDQSGRGFWPTPAMFPSLLAQCLSTLQQEITRLYLAAQVNEADCLAACRCDLLAIVSEGDLGENHTRIFLDEHPAIAKLGSKETRDLPFFALCSRIAKMTNPLSLLGALVRNEEGSLAEVTALHHEHLVAGGQFAELHMVEEEEHAKIGLQITERLNTQPAFWDDFKRGQILHDRVYRKTIAGNLQSPS